MADRLDKLVAEHFRKEKKSWRMKERKAVKEKRLDDAEVARRTVVHIVNLLATLEKAEQPQQEEEECDDGEPVDSSLPLKDFRVHFRSVPGMWELYNSFHDVSARTIEEAKDKCFARLRGEFPDRSRNGWNFHKVETDD
jgi:hypothetical protein